MMKKYAPLSIVATAILASTLVAVTEGFAPISSRGHLSSATHNDGSLLVFSPPSRVAGANKLQYPKLPDVRRTELHMSDEREGPGIATAIFIVGVLGFFVLSAFAPLIDFAANSPSPKDLSLGDSVVTRQDEMTKLKNYQSKFDALSPAKVQEKLSNLPVFYVIVNGGMGDKIYLSYSEAESVAQSSEGTLKVTTLDQVMYPLILKREGGKTITPTPVEIKEAKNSVETRTFSLVPASSATKDAGDMTIREGDIPLFVVERLAFAGNDGRPQVPLFTEKGDAITSYARLQEGSSTLPKEPSIRTTSLLDVLESMEKGTRPAVSQLQFYGNADDVMKADEMSR